MVSFIAIALLASIAGIVGMGVSIKLNKDYSTALVVNGFAQGDLGRFDTALNKGASLVRDIIFLTDAAELNTTNQELEIVLKEANQALAELKVNCQTPAEVEQIKIIDANLPLYQEKRQNVIDLGLANKNDEALQLLRTEATPYLNKCIDAVEALIIMNEEMGNETAKALATQAGISVAVIIAVIAAALIVSILLGTTIARSIARPIQACSDRLTKLAEGDLHSPVPESQAKDEAGLMLEAMKTTTQTMQKIIEDIGDNLGEMARGNLDIRANANYCGDFEAIRDSIDQIAESLNDTMTKINRAANEVSNGAEQVSSGAQALSQGATEQASSVQELAATINEVSSQVKKNAANAGEASSQMNSVGSEVAQCNEQMNRMTEAMANINEKSNQIGRIIKTIEDIAFQTNILALNAAVEAARAGAAGKGFAVVADEVRSLAAKSGEAAQNTTELIEGSISAVAVGTELAEETARSLLTVVEGTEKVKDTIQLIAEASGSQAEAVGQITVGVDQISSVVQTNSATAEESAAASEELSSQSQMLKDLVSKFRIKAERGMVRLTD